MTYLFRTLCIALALFAANVQVGPKLPVALVS